LKRVTPELAPELYELASADVRGKGKDATQDLAQIEALKAHAERLIAEGAALSVRDLKVDGRTIMQAFDRRPGPWLGELLRTLLDEVVENPSLNERERLLERARSLVAANPN
ncbi:MAG TPA: hypothetical protein VFQ35_02060, partial [Polyangiaceae bacterium]|nr:hypothetical protein [Polyangiaceae bacterium]